MYCRNPTFWIHSDESSSSSSSLESSISSNGSEFEVFDDTDLDKNWNPSSSDEENSEDTLQKEIIRVVMTQILSSSDSRIVL